MISFPAAIERIARHAVEVAIQDQVEAEMFLRRMGVFTIRPPRFYHAACRTYATPHDAFFFVVAHDAALWVWEQGAAAMFAAACAALHDAIAADAAEQVA